MTKDEIKALQIKAAEIIDHFDNRSTVYVRSVKGKVNHEVYPLWKKAVWWTGLLHLFGYEISVWKTDKDA